MNHQTTRSPRAPARTFGLPARVLFGLAAGAIAIFSAGCYATAGTSGAVVYDEPSVEVDTVPVTVETVPVEVEAYPTYVYRGSNVYLVDGRWYSRSARGWVVYRSEPRPLASVRVRYEARFGAHYRPRHENASPRPLPHHHRHHH